MYALLEPDRMVHYKTIKKRSRERGEGERERERERDG
jgi:hypothetical protein